jgi:transcriptional regulator with XRE-family HTH domain
VSDLGALVRTARIARGWSQQQAADAAGVSRRFVNMLEGGRHANAEVGRVLALLDALDVHLVGALPGQERATVEEPQADEPEAVDLDAYVSTFRKPRDAQ